MQRAPCGDGRENENPCHCLSLGQTKCAPDDDRTTEERNGIVLRTDGKPASENSFSHQKHRDKKKDYFEVASDRQTRVQVQVSLRYMNTSSTKIFMMIFDLCQDAVAKGRDVVIQWRHHKEDDLIREMGEDLSDGLKVPFQFVAEE